MATRSSSSRSSNMKTTLSRRLQPSILRRKRKIERQISESLSVVSLSESPCSKSPVSKLHCGSDQRSPPTRPSSPAASATFSSNSDIQPLQSSTIEPPSSEWSIPSDPQLSSCEEIGLSSPAGPRPFRSETCLPSPELSRRSPLPNLSWADPKEVWELMVRKDTLYPRSATLLKYHPQLQPRMRAILLEWLMEVSEVYKLHRETYYLAQDFIDRYLASQRDLPKQQLQLLGITCLFLASKIEEIYPPKLSEFSYVTDNACTENEIIEKELVVLKVLNWDLTPLTVNGWLNVYLQLASSIQAPEDADTFVFPDYPGIVLVKVAQLVDLCMLDVQALRFPYGIIAATALYHITSRNIALTSSGLDWVDLSECVSWMKAFAVTIRESASEPQLGSFSNVLSEDQHNIQTHTIDLKLLEKALNRQEETQSSRHQTMRGRAMIQSALSRGRSPCLQMELLTPPKSAKKSAKRCPLLTLSDTQI